MWLLFVGIFVVLYVLFTQFYKIDTAASQDDGALTVLLQFLGGCFGLCLCPFFEFKLPTDWRVYALLATACVFYAISDRMNTTVRAGIEASTFSIIQQLSTVFMILAGILFFKEPIIMKKLVGAALIVFSNVMIFYKHGEQKLNKYVVLGIVACIAYTAGLFIDVNLSSNFNVAFYASLTLLIPAFILMISERISPRKIINEFKVGNKKSIIATSACWGPMLVFQLRAYQIGDVTVVAPLCALIVIGCVIAGYLFLNERDDLLKKLIAAIIIVISVILIKG